MSNKTKEEYLLSYEEALLKKLSDNFSSLNRDLIVCYSLLFAFLLFRYNLITKTTIVGNEINLNLDQALVTIPLFICIVYLLINNSIFRITQIINLLNKNSVELKIENSNPRPFGIPDLEFLIDGIAGLQLQFSKWIVGKIANKNFVNFNINVPPKKNFYNILIFSIRLPFAILSKSNRTFKNLLILFFWILLLILVFLIPLGIPAIILYEEKVSLLLDRFMFPHSIFDYNLLVLICLVAVIVYTIIANLILNTFYFSELKKIKEDLIIMGYSSFLDTFLKIKSFYNQKGSTK